MLRVVAHMEDECRFNGWNIESSTPAGPSAEAPSLIGHPCLGELAIDSLRDGRGYCDLRM